MPKDLKQYLLDAYLQLLLKCLFVLGEKIEDTVENCYVSEITIAAFRASTLKA